MAEHPGRQLAAVFLRDRRIVGVKARGLGREYRHVAIEKQRFVEHQRLAGPMAVARRHADQCGDALRIDVRVRQPARDRGLRELSAERFVVLASGFVDGVVIEQREKHLGRRFPAGSNRDRVELRQYLEHMVEIVISTQRRRTACAVRPAVPAAAAAVRRNRYHRFARS